MSRVQDGDFSLNSFELKALSIPTSLRFLLGAEYDIFLCLSGSPKRPFEIFFPLFAPTYRRLLASCARKFHLECRHDEHRSVISGSGRLPMLRYADFLPGSLHVDEVLACLGVCPIARPRNNVGQESSSAATTIETIQASFISYEEYRSDESLLDVHGIGFYLCIEYGLSLATHSHLVRILFRRDRVEPQDGKNNHGTSLTKRVNWMDAVGEFQKFSGWSKFDLRFDDDSKMSGVVVLPSAQDALDLFEKYEDEETDDEDDPLPFQLRPIASSVPVPTMEDAPLRKLRGQHWEHVVDFWKRFPKTSNTIVVSNLFNKATIDDVINLFDGLVIISLQLVEDESPHRRRRAYVTFSDSNGARKALGLDSKNTHGKALRIAVSPPFIDVQRRGCVIASFTETVKTSVQPVLINAAIPSSVKDEVLPDVAAAIITTAVSPKPVPIKALNVDAKEFVPRFLSPQFTSAPPPYLPSPILTMTSREIVAGVELVPSPPLHPPGYQLSPPQYSSGGVEVNTKSGKSPLQPPFAPPPYSLPPAYESELLSPFPPSYVSA